MDSTKRKREEENIIKLDINGVEITDYKPRLLSPDYYTCPKLDQAYGYRDQCKHQVPIFALDKINGKTKGAKKFVAASYNQLFINISKTYNNLGPGGLLPGFYEVIGESRPCNLYMDLEYDFEGNTKDDPLEILKSFVADIREYLKHIGILRNGRGVEVFTLYSPNSEKASYHLHLIGNNWVFENLFHCGAFVRHFVLWCLDKYGSDESKNKYFFKKKLKSGEIVYRFFADLGVYTGNRVLRTAYSSKECGLGNKAPLLAFSEWKTIGFSMAKLFKIRPNIQNFLKSTPLYIANDGKYTVIKMRDPGDADPRSTSFTGFIKNGKMTKYNTDREIVFDGNLSDQIVQVCLEIVSEFINKEFEVYPISHSKESKMCVIGTYSTRCPINESKTGSLTHKSNHIYFVVYYTKGNMKLKCKDEDCQGCITYAINENWIPNIYQSLTPDDYFVNEGNLLRACQRLAEIGLENGIK